MEDAPEIDPAPPAAIDAAPGGGIRRDPDEHLRALVDRVADLAIFMLDARGNVATWNAGAERLMGYPSTEILGRHFSRFYLPEDIAAGKPRLVLAMAEREGGCEQEGWRLRQDGARFWAKVVITALRDGAGRLVGYGKVARDISRQHRATEQFRLAIEAAPTGMIMFDERGQIVMVNAHVEGLFGYPREELIGLPVEILIPERFRARHPGFRTSYLDPRSRPMGAGRDLFGLRKDGSEVPIEIGLNPIEAPQQGIFILGSIVDITARKRSEQERENLLDQLQALNAGLEARVRERTAELTATLKERDVLLQEIHHRVKNNLQVVSSLLSLQVRSLADAAGRDALVECQGRVQAIALIHEQLYQSENYTRVPFSDYAKSLAANVFAVAGASPGAVSLSLAVEDLALPVDRAIPCGLILNELITNALKHGFPDGRKGTIEVELAKMPGGRVRLGVSDDGIGLPPGVDALAAGSLGLQLVQMLARQVDAELAIGTGHGTSFRMTFSGEE